MSLRDVGIKRADALAVAILYLMAGKPRVAEDILASVRWSK